MFAEVNEACGGALNLPAPAEFGPASGVRARNYAGIAYDYDAAGALALQTEFFGSAKRDDGFQLDRGRKAGCAVIRYASGGGGLYGGFAVTSKHNFRAAPRL